MAFPKNEKIGLRLFVLIGGGVALTLLISLLLSVVLLVSGGGADDINRNISLFKGTQLLMTICAFLLPALIVAAMSRPRGIAYLGADKKPVLPVLLLVAGMVLSVQPLMNATTEWFANWSLPAPFAGLEHWLKHLEKENSDLVRAFLDVHSVGGFLFNILLVAIAPAVCEEFFFRGGLQRLLSEKINFHLAIWITAVVFSAVHFEVSGFLPRALLGALLGYLFFWTGSIWVSVAAHFVNNLFGVIMEFLIFNGYVDKNLEHFGSCATLGYSITGIVLFVALLSVLYRKREKTESRV